MEETMTIEDNRLMELEQARLADERAEAETEEEQSADALPRHLINTGEAALLLGFTGFIELLQWLIDGLPAALTATVQIVPGLGQALGVVMGPALEGVSIAANIIITLFVGGTLLFWVHGKTQRGAPKKWYKVIYIGATGAVIPIIPGFLGAIIYLVMIDRKAFGKLGTKLMEKAEKI